MRQFVCWIIVILSAIFSANAQTGPGGVGTLDGTSVLELWITADEGITGSSPITSIVDQSGNNHVITINGDPTLSTSSINGHNEIVFDGTGDYLDTDLSINADSLPEVDIYCVYTCDGSTSVGAPWGEDNGGFDRFILRSNNAGPGCSYGVSEGAMCSNVNAMFPANSPVITTVMYDEDGGASSYVLVNCSSWLAFGSNHGPESSNNFQIAALGAGNYTFDGELAEILVFNENLNWAQLAVLHNHLGAKYGITLEAFAMYQGGTSANGDCDFDVTGIGRFDASNILDDAQGLGMVRILNPSNLDDWEFLIFGHNNAAAEANNTTDVPSGVSARFERVWFVSENDPYYGNTVDVGSVDIRFELTGYGTIQASDLRLLVDTDNDDDFTDETPISGATYLPGTNFFEFTGVTALANNTRFTLATANASSTPLPVVLDYINILTVLEGVSIEWGTLTEINCDRFVVEKSVDAKNWIKIAEIDGNGTESIPQHYSYLDKFPFDGNNYYRVKQIDFNGAYTYFDVLSIDINDNVDIKCYPSPASSFLQIEGVSIDDVISIKSVLGVDFKNGISIIGINNGKTEVDVSSLPAGIYFIMTVKGSIQFIKL